MEVTKIIKEAYIEKLYELAIVKLRGFKRFKGSIESLFYTIDGKMYITNVEPYKNLKLCYLITKSLMDSFMKETGNQMPPEEKLSKGFKNSFLALLENMDIKTKLELLSAEQRQPFADLEHDLLSVSRKTELTKNLHTTILEEYKQRAAEELSLEAYAVLYEVEKLIKNHNLLDNKPVVAMEESKTLTQKQYRAVKELAEEKFKKTEHRKEEVLSKPTKAVNVDTDIEGHIN